MTRTTIGLGVVLAAGWAHADNVVRAVDFAESGGRTEVVVHGGSAPTFTTYKLDRPTRVVVDIANARLGDVESPIDADTWAVSQVAVQQFRSDDRAIARVMVALKRECSYDVRAQGNDVHIVLTPSAPKPASPGDEAAQRERARAEAALADADRAGAVAREANQAAERERKAAEQAKSEAAEARRSAESVGKSAAAGERDRKAALEATRAAQEKQRDAEGRLGQAEKALADAERLRAEAEGRAKQADEQRAAEAGKRRDAEKRAAVAEGAKAGDPGGKTVRVLDVTYAEGDDRATVTVKLRGQPEWTLLPPDGRRAVLELRGTELGPGLERKLDTRAFHGPVAAVSTYRVAGGQGVRLVAELQGDVRHRVEAVPGALRWSFDKPKASASTTAPAPASYPPARMGGFESSSAALALAAPAPKAHERYAGRRIDLDFKDADIQNLLRLLSDVGEVNIVTSDDVKGSVTIRMRNVPWDQALDVILRSKGLGQVREGNLIRVEPLVVLQKERDEEIARLKQVEELKPIETRLVPLSYAKAADVVQRTTDFLSARGKVSFDERTNQVVARDTSERLDVIEKLIRELDTQTPQVTIEARIIEANTNFVRDLGVQWGGDITSSAATGNPTGLVFPSELGVGGSGFTTGIQQNFVPGASPNPNFAVNLPATASEGHGGAVGIHMGSVSGAFNLNLRLSAAEDTEQVRILSAPKVTTLDNHEATVTSGVSIPFATVSAQGTQTTFQEAVLGLKVTPHVTADGSVIMSLDITKAEPGSATPQGQVTITKKAAKTEMLVKDGDTAVIGGIYTRTTGITRNKVPWFAELPILGYFFRHENERDNRSEVLVFITPRIVNRSVALGR